MKLLVTGARGMLGRTLLDRLTEHNVQGTDVEDCDITNANSVQALIDQVQPDVVIHCAAMTAVDECESNQQKAWAVNAVGSANVAIVAHRRGARLIAVSTDYVFSGDLHRPYHEWDEVDPRSVYGQSKLAGEQAIRTHCPDHVIARIAWLYGPGGPSFVHTMLRLGKAEGPPVKVVDDQIGNPTSTFAVAETIKVLLERPICGTIHMTCEGEATWFALARTIFDRTNSQRDVVPCKTEDFPRPAPRPRNSRLENRALRLHGLPPMPDWRNALEQFLQLE